MVKRNTNFKQMFLADNILIDVINSQSHSSYKNANNFAFNQHNSCVECESYKKFKSIPFPETIRDSNGNINPDRSDGNSSSSDSSSDGENGNNDDNSLNQRIMQPISNNGNIDNNYNPSNQRMTQPQSNDENRYNSLNQRIIQPLPNDSSSDSSNESDSENLDRPQNPQNLSLNNDNNINQRISTQAGLDIDNEAVQIRQENKDFVAGEEQFVEPLSEDQFMDVNVPNISPYRGSAKKRKEFKIKTRRKKYVSLPHSREKKLPVDKDQIDHKIRRLYADATAGEEQFNAPVPEEEFMDVNVPPPYSRDKKLTVDGDQDDHKIRVQDIDETVGEEQFNAPVPEEEIMDINVPIKTKSNSKEEYEQIKKAKVFLHSSKKKQRERKKKLRLLKLKNQRLRQLYSENKNQILENEQLQKDGTLDENVYNDSKLHSDHNQQRTDTLNEHFDIDEKYNNESKDALTVSKKPTIRLRKFAYGTLPEQENISKPEIRVAKFANQELIRDKQNITNNLQYFCELCKMKFAKYSFLKQHLQANHGKKQYKMDFPDAGKYLALAKKVENKNDRSEFFYQNFNANNDASADITSYWCSKCQKFLQNFKIMQKHMLDHEEGETAAKRSITRERKPQNNKKILYESYN